MRDARQFAGRQPLRADGADELVSTADAGIDVDSTAETLNLSVALTLLGVSFTDANAFSSAEGVGMDGGTGADILSNEGELTGTIDATATGRSLSLARAGGAGASANSTARAAGGAQAGGAGDDRMENSGNVALTFDATASGQGIGISGGGLALSDASANSVVEAFGQRGDAGEDDLVNSGGLGIDATATTNAVSIAATAPGVSIASANSIADASATGLSGGDANDDIANQTGGVVEVLSSAVVISGSAAVTLAGASDAEARTGAKVLATGLAGDAGDDRIANAGRVTVMGVAESTAGSGSISVAGSSSARAGTEVETTAIGISGGAGLDTIENAGTLVVGPEAQSGEWMARLATDRLRRFRRQYGSAVSGYAHDGHRHRRRRERRRREFRRHHRECNAGATRLRRTQHFGSSSVGNRAFTRGRNRWSGWGRRLVLGRCVVAESLLAQRAHVTFGGSSGSAPRWQR
jgi:hypothetical protein